MAPSLPHCLRRHPPPTHSCLCIVTGRAKHSHARARVYYACASCGAPQRAYCLGPARVRGAAHLAGVSLDAFARRAIHCSGSLLPHASFAPPPRSGHTHKARNAGSHLARHFGRSLSRLSPGLLPRRRCLTPKAILAGLHPAALSKVLACSRGAGTRSISIRARELSGNPRVWHVCWHSCCRRVELMQGLP